MKKKSLIIHIIVMLVCVFIGGRLASSLVNEYGNICVSKKMERGKNIFGVNRFAADVQWMLFINYCGMQDKITKENAPIIYRKANAILDNNPDFEQAYEMSSLLLAVEEPEMAINILQRACDNPRLKSNWKLPFLAGFIASHHLKDKDYARAENFLQIAASRSTPPEPFVISALMRVKAKRLMETKKWRGIPIVDENQALLCTLVDSYAARSRHTEDLNSPYTAEILCFGKMTIPEKMLSLAQSLREENKDNPDIEKTIERMKSTLFKGRHICEGCLTPYEAGDKFCSKCGAMVKVYGACAKCGAVKKGRFCSECGAE